MKRKTLATLDSIGDRQLRQRLPESVKVIRAKPQYPSWPAPVRQFICECGFTLELKKSGRAEIRHAVSLLRSHVIFDPKHRRWVMAPEVERERSPARSRKRKAAKSPPRPSPKRGSRRRSPTLKSPRKRGPRSKAKR
jgi:hypothetical protein